MSQLVALQTQAQQKFTEYQALLAKQEGLSVEEMSTIKALDGELDVLNGQIKDLKEIEDLRAKATQHQAWLTQPQNRLPLPSGSGMPAPAADPTLQPDELFKSMRGRRAGQAKFFAGCEPYAEGRGSAEQAHRFGMWILAEAKRDPYAAKWCQERGIKTMVEGFNDSGGALVPDEFENTLIDLREVFGVFRRYAQVMPMASDTKIVPRRVGGLTAYAVGEAAAITTSDMTWDNVMLVAKKWGVLSKVSSELNEDAIIDMGNTLAGEIAYAFSVKEDDCGFNGDGTSAYHGITGVRAKLLALSGTIANIAGLVVGTAPAASYGSLTLANFQDVVARLPQYADTPNARWFVHRGVFFGVMQKLALAAGGVTAAEVTAGGREFRFLGYPVAFSQILPNVPATSSIIAILGDMAKAALFGDRRMTQIALSEHSDFANDLIAIRGTERFDINVHSVGNASATATLRVPGPITALITAAS